MLVTLPFYHDANLITKPDDLYQVSYVPAKAHFLPPFQSISFVIEVIKYSSSLREEDLNSEDLRACIKTIREISPILKVIL